MKKIYVMVDLEGISGIYSRDQVRRDGADFGNARRFMTDDINACVEGLARGGAGEILVYDCHGGSYTAVWDQLDSRAEYIMGSGRRERMPFIDGSDGLVLLGYHAMAGTENAVLEHTFTSSSWQNLWINGRRAGELGVDGAIAGEHGVPVIMISGCDKACAEARDFFPDVCTAQVKTGLAVYCARLLPADKARALITVTAEKAAGMCGRIKPYVPGAPVTLRLEMVERGSPPYPDTRPWMKLIDARTCEVTGDGFEQAWNRLTR